MEEDGIIITVAMVKAARALLGWNARDLARESGVGLSTLWRIEGRTGELTGSDDTYYAIKDALDRAGVVFVTGGVCLCS